jgi:hypothetical protein
VSLTIAKRRSLTSEQPEKRSLPNCVVKLAAAVAAHLAADSKATWKALCVAEDRLLDLAGQHPLIAAVAAAILADRAAFASFAIDEELGVDVDDHEDLDSLPPASFNSSFLADCLAEYRDALAKAAVVSLASIGLADGST